MHVRLILSASLPAISGAVIYDHAIARGLRELGHTVEVTKEQALPSDGVVLVDGSALPDFAGRELSRVTALVHHPLSLDTVPPDAQMRVRETAMFGAVRHIVTTSEQTADRLAAEFSVPREKITAVSPGTDVLPRSAGSGGRGCRILSVGQLIPRKGHDVLMRSLSRLFDLDWTLVIVGGAIDPVYASGLASLAEELGITKRVAFLGEVTGDALESEWQNADLFALTSHFEGYGMVFAEALRRGLPVAATSTGAVPTLIGPECGVVCAPSDVEQLAKALRRLIFDKALRLHVAEAAWHAGQDLPSWRDQAAKLAAVLR